MPLVTVPVGVHIKTKLLHEFALKGGVAGGGGRGLFRGLSESSRIGCSLAHGSDLEQKHVCHNPVPGAHHALHRLPPRPPVPPSHWAPQAQRTQGPSVELSETLQKRNERQLEDSSAMGRHKYS